MKRIHLEIYLKSEQPVQLPIHYNHIIQAVILNSFDSDLAKFLHNKGYRFNERTFKMYTFSRINGTFYHDKGNKNIVFHNELKLVVSTPLDDFCQSFANVLLSRGSMKFGKQDLEIEKITAMKHMVQGESIIVRTLSPVVVYSTLFKADGRKYTCYFQPDEPDFNSLIDHNLRKKYAALYGVEPPGGKVEATSKSSIKLSIVKYKGTIIKGYSGRLLLKGPAPLLQVAVDAGLGSKNSQGFGCLEPIKKRGERRC